MGFPSRGSLFHLDLLTTLQKALLGLLLYPIVRSESPADIQYKQLGTLLENPMRTIAALLLLSLLTACGSSVEPSALKLDHTPPPLFEDRTLDRVTFLTSHNAFANEIKFIALNQEHTITEQLENDNVRGLMLDIYTQDGQAALCHPKCKIPILNISTWRPLSDDLKQIEDFMKKDPRAIITLHLEWTSGSDGARADLFEAAFDKLPDLKNMIFDPYKADVKANGWPKIRDMIASNKRLLILSQSDSTRGMGVGYDRDFVVENYWSMGPLAQDRECRSRWNEIPLDRESSSAHKFRRLFIMNHFRDIPSSLTAAIDNTWDSLWGRVTTDCLVKARRIPNYIALDYVNKGTGHETVDALNRAIGIAFEHGSWQGQTHLMMPGNEDIEGGDGKLQDNAMSSVEIFWKGSRVALFDNKQQEGFLLDVNETMQNLPREFNDRVSSWRVDN
jgi:hypothetical protein